MSYSPTLVLRACKAKRLDIATAWAVLIGTEECPSLFGVRATEVEAQKLARYVRNAGSDSRIMQAKDLTHA